MLFREYSAYSGPELRKALSRFGAFLRDSGADIERAFQSRLKALGFSPEQRKLISAITPGGAVRAIQHGGSPGQFFDEAVLSCRELAGSGAERDEVRRAIQEYIRIATGEVRNLANGEQAEVGLAQAQIQNALLVLVSDVFASLMDGHARLLEALETAENGAANLEEFAKAILPRLIEHFGATGAVWFSETDHQMMPIAHVGVRISKGEVQGINPHRHSDRVLSLRSGNRLHASKILVKAWKLGKGSVWSVGSGATLIQLRHPEVREPGVRETEVLRLAVQHCAHAADRLARESELRALSLRLLEVEEIERRRISRELHDDAGQSLVVIRLQLELLELSLGAESENIRQSAAEIRTIVERTILGVRRLISDLSPAVLEQLGLGAAVRQLAKRFRSSSEANIILQISDLPRLNPRLELVIYRILQECFVNISRHSAAKTVKLCLEAPDNMLRLTVEDDGCGFEVTEGISRRNCFGLRGIRERTELLGGRFEVTSTPIGGEKRAGAGGSAGTKVSIQLPLPG